MPSTITSLYSLQLTTTDCLHLELTLEQQVVMYVLLFYCSHLLILYSIIAYSELLSFAFHCTGSSLSAVICEQFASNAVHDKYVIDGSCLKSYTSQSGIHWTESECLYLEYAKLSCAVALSPLLEVSVFNLKLMVSQSFKSTFLKSNENNETSF